MEGADCERLELPCPMHPNDVSCNSTLAPVVLRVWCTQTGTQWKPQLKKCNAYAAGVFPEVDMWSLDGRLYLVSQRGSSGMGSPNTNPVIHWLSGAVYFVAMHDGHQVDLRPSDMPKIREVITTFTECNHATSIMHDIVREMRTHDSAMQFADLLHTAQKNGNIVLVDGLPVPKDVDTAVRLNREAVRATEPHRYNKDWDNTTLRALWDDVRYIRSRRFIK